MFGLQLLGMGEGVFNNKTSKLNKFNPMLRDTLTLPVSEGGRDGGGTEYRQREAEG